MKINNIKNLVSITYIENMVVLKGIKYQNTKYFSCLLYANIANFI
jgi:hypothetical protein